MSEEKKFNPQAYLTKLKGKDYLEVKWRLLWLRTEHPEAVIETQLERLEEDFALFHARVTLPGGAAASGWGSETKKDFNDFIEKSETKALGRALGALGFGTQFGVEFDEGVERDGAPSMVDAPVAAPARAVPPEDPLVAEWNRAKALARRAGREMTWLTDTYVTAYKAKGVTKPAELTLEMLRERNGAFEKWLEESEPAKA
jgi:hypothetical protein